MDIKCPFCGGLMESDVEVAVGQQIECPRCGRVFAFARSQDVPTRIALPLEAAKRRSSYDEKSVSWFRHLIAPWRKRHWTALADAPWQLQVIAVVVVLMSLFSVCYRCGYGCDWIWTIEAIVAIGAFIPLLTYSSRIRLLVIVLSMIGTVNTLIDGRVWESINISVVFAGLLLSKSCNIWYRQHHIAQREYGVVDVVRSVCGNLQTKPLAVILTFATVALCIRSDVHSVELEREEVDTNVVSRGGRQNANARLLGLKSWYRQQLDHNGVQELSFESRLDKKCGNSYYLTLSDENCDFVKIQLENMQYLSWPKSMAKGYAEKLIKTRIEILNLEDAEASVKDVFYTNGVKD